jgi:hypothetical protein
VAADLGGLRAFSSQLPGLFPESRLIPLRLRSGEGRHGVIVGCQSWVILCKWAGGGVLGADLKEINARCGSGFGGICAVIAVVGSMHRIGG